MKNFGINVRHHRLSRQLTLKELSAISGVSLSMLSEIERNIKMPTIEVACKIADALEVNILELLNKKEMNTVKVIRKNEHPLLIGPGPDSYKRFLLSPSLPFSLIHFEYCVIPYGKSTGPIAGHNPPLKKYIVVASGKLTLHLGEDEKDIALSEGDAIAYQIFTEYELINSGDGEARFYYISENRVK